MKSEACSAEQVLASARQNSLYLKTQILARAHEHLLCWMRLAGSPQSLFLLLIFLGDQRKQEEGGGYIIAAINLTTQVMK